MAAGLALVPEDRRKQGLVLEESVARNSTLAIRTRLSKLGLIRNSAENASARVWASRLQLKTNALDTLVGTLSGGNQQKVVLGKWLSTEPRVLIIDEPTRGIDVGTKAEVHRLLSELAGRGMGILMISSELPEVLGMADRVLVVREGRITAELDRADADAENVMFAATHAAEEAAR
ncbi:ABC transporter, ATP-binding protein [Leifsonia aquatica ATCC 14665]|nr:ABC transporter, ATP-binding protein [Leifsonia aquatica ATCC 14665]